jgi:hypothetical protein
MKKIIYPLFFFTLVLISCENDDENAIAKNADMTITVYNAEEWSVETTQPFCEGAEVKLISQAQTLTATTNIEGKVIFKDFEFNIYEIQVTKGDLSNIFAKNNSGKGFVAIGIFQNQSEIDSYLGGPYVLQPDAIPGDLMIKNIDTNEKIDDRDRVSSTYYIPYIDLNHDEIIDDLDKKNGSFVLKENVNMDVYIGR